MLFLAFAFFCSLGLLAFLSLHLYFLFYDLFYVLFFGFFLFSRSDSVFFSFFGSTWGVLSVVAWGILM